MLNRIVDRNILKPFTIACRPHNLALNSRSPLRVTERLAMVFLVDASAVGQCTRCLVNRIGRKMRSLNRTALAVGCMVTYTKKDRKFFRESGSIGGKKGAAALTPEERKNKASKAAQ